MHQRNVTELIRLSRAIGREEYRLALFAEGNTSCLINESSFAVKASGTRLAELTEADVTVCRLDKVRGMLDEPGLSDSEIDQRLMEARVDSSAKKPSVEAMFHAWLLTLDGVDYVGHCHAEAVNQILCSPMARDFAERRMFPDEVVYCGPASVLVPYVDPGLVLAREIRTYTKEHIRKHQMPPRLILLRNHGIIAIGESPDTVLAGLMMANKAASIFLGAAALGGPTFLSAQEVKRIAGRPDEAYRQQQLRL